MCFTRRSQKQKRAFFRECSAALRDPLSLRGPSQINDMLVPRMCFTRRSQKQKRAFVLLAFVKLPLIWLSSDLAGSRTPNLLIRSQVLYPIKLRGQKECKYNNLITMSIHSHEQCSLPSFVTLPQITLTQIPQSLSTTFSQPENWVFLLMRADLK